MLAEKRMAIITISNKPDLEAFIEVLVFSNNKIVLVLSFGFVYIQESNITIEGKLQSISPLSMLWDLRDVSCNIAPSVENNVQKLKCHEIFHGMFTFAVQCR